MRAFEICTFFMLLLKSSSEVALEELDSAPSLVKKLTAICGKDGIKVVVRFYHPFTGVVYSDGHYDTPSCVFINQENNTAPVPTGETRFSFLIPADECGTIFHDPGSSLATLYNGGNGATIPPTDASDNEVYMENTVMFQRNHFIQEQGDLAQTLRCVWQKEIRRPLQATLPLMSKHRRQKRPTEKPHKSDVTGSNWNHHHRNASSSYVPSSFYERHSVSTGSKKRFRPKGHVESISFGRRNGKSIDIDSYSEDEPTHDLMNLRSSHNHNLTALPFKADIKNSGASILSSILIAKTIILHWTTFHILSCRVLI